MQTQARPDLTRIFLVILIIAILIVGSLWTLLPFLAALLWAATIVIATWPFMLRVERRVGGKRSIATAVMTLVMLAIFILPLGLATGVLLDAATQGVEFVKGLTTTGLQPPPDWLAGIPWVGQKLNAKWQELSAAGPEGLAELLRPYLRATASWALAVTGGLGATVLHFLLTVIVAGILYANGETAARGVIAFARRLGRDRAEHSVRLAAQAIRGVALGVVVTALAESLIAAAGLWLAGVPSMGLIVAIIFVFGIAQLGPVLPMIGVVIWAFWAGKVLVGVLMIALTVALGIVDNVMKPILIQRGVQNLPLFLIVAGVIGGLVSFGVIGLFIGPVILAVTYTLLKSWIEEDPEAAR
jgi:predicted PurR-regulated permease PerM